MSQTQAAEAVGLSRRNVSDFLRSNAIKALLGEGDTGTILEPKSLAIRNRDYKNKVRLRGLKRLKPAQAGFVFIAAVSTAKQSSGVKPR